MMLLRCCCYMLPFCWMMFLRGHCALVPVGHMDVRALDFQSERFDLVVDKVRTTEGLVVQ
jgi:hypothetical protein